MSRVSEGTSASCSALRSVPSSSTPAHTPASVPRPPKMETPPSSTAATTASSSPSPLSARALAYRSVQYTPARPDTAPDATNSQNFRRATAMPEKRAASALLPIAYNSRPAGVACSRRPKTTASSAVPTIAHGSAPPGTVPTTASVQSPGKSATAWSPSTTNARPR